MKVYIDLIIIINTLYDFLILSSVSILLKRHVGIKKILLGCLVGMSTLVTLFLRLDSIILLLFKIVTSISMVVLTFGPKNFLENIFYFYIITIIIGGSQYLITGNRYEVNIFTMAIISPIIIGLYIKSERDYKLKYTKIHNVIIIDGNNAYNLNGFMDTGNSLVDPITKLPVLMISKKYKFESKKYFYVPYNVLNNSSVLKCVKVDKVLVNSKEMKVLLGLADDNIFKSGIDVILNEFIREMI